MAQNHSTSENWPNSLDPQRSHNERSLANWKNISYRRQRHSSHISTKSRQRQELSNKIPAIHLAPTEAEERLHHDDYPDEEEEEEPKVITHWTEHMPAKTNSIL